MVVRLHTSKTSIKAIVLQKQTYLQKIDSIDTVSLKNAHNQFSQIYKDKDIEQGSTH